MEGMRTLVLFIFLGTCTLTYGQTGQTEGVLTGLVYDDHGAVITNAILRVRGADKTERVARTNEDGVFEIKLKPGNYSIQVESPGFQTAIVEKFRVIPSYKGKQNLDIALEVGPCSDCHMIEAPIKKPKIKTD